MNINNFVQNIETNEQNKEKAWRNFMKTGRIEDYLIYFACKNPRLEACKDAHSN